jgi:hypothetical protein
MQNPEVNYFVEYAKKIASDKGYKFSEGCESDLISRLSSSGSIYHEDSRPDSEKRRDAEDSIERLVNSMITASQDRSVVPFLDPGVLHEPTLEFAWGEWCKKMDLWPWCRHNKPESSQVPDDNPPGSEQPLEYFPLRNDEMRRDDIRGYDIRGYDIRVIEGRDKV